MRYWGAPVTQAYCTPPLSFFVAARRGASVVPLFLSFLSFAPDRQRMGWEGHDRGCLPGHRGHEVRVAFLREVRTHLRRKNKNILFKVPFHTSDRSSTDHSHLTI